MFVGQADMAYGSNACKLIKARVEVDGSFTALNRDAALHGKETHSPHNGKDNLGWQNHQDPARPIWRASYLTRDRKQTGVELHLRVCDGLNSSPWRDVLIKSWEQDSQGL